MRTSFALRALALRLVSKVGIKHLRLTLTILGAALSISASNPPEAAPIPEQKPQAPISEAAPLPEPRPVEQKAAPAEPQASPPPEAEPDAASPEPKKDFPKCEMELKKNGAVFEPIEPINDGGGCGIARPVELRAINAEIKLDAPATLSCDAALALTNWVQQSVVPNLELAFPDKQLASLSNASSYVCRNRNHAQGGKISEHAKGNAFDIASLTFSDKSKLIMKPRTEDGTIEGALQRTITTSACLFFRTVLSPGSDATHQNHLHLDVMQRKNDFRFCR